MPNFVNDGTALAAAKSDFRTQPGVPATQKVVAVDWNQFRQALIDIQSFLRVGAGGVISGPQRFVFTVTGSENGLSQFNVNLPTARANTNYVARVEDGGTVSGNLRNYVAPIAGYTTSLIQVKAAAAVATGDKLIITVDDLT